MTDKFTVRTQLRDATQDLHERVDSAFSQADLSERGGYMRFLTAQAEAHAALEAVIDRSGITDILPDWPERRRVERLRSDLAELGAAMPEPAAVPELTSNAAALGTAYVLEGSRLGGTLLKRSVPADLPASFLGAADSGAWRRLLAILDEHLVHAEQIQIAINAARDAFMIFERSGRKLSKASGIGS